MGLLDDAIRQHLDLKRSRGADPAEIEKAEREALGPVRRQAPIGSFSDEPPVSPVMDEHQPGTWDQPEPQASRPPKRRGLLHRRSTEPDTSFRQVEPEAAAPPPEEFPPGHPDEPYADEVDDREQVPPVVDQLTHPELADVEASGQDDLAAEELSRYGTPTPTSPPTATAPPTLAPAPPDPEHNPAPDETRGETVEYDVEGAFQGPPADDDVLEETPEFLQDTPDHDRLWFEQRPPRDFDFEG